MNKYKLKHHNIDEMTKVLEQRNLIVDKKEILEKINYAHLIYKYSEDFYQDNQIKYIDNTKLSHIYELFLLNKKISLILFELIYDFEHRLKNTIAFEITKEKSDDYLKLEQIYKKEILKKKYFSAFLKKLKKANKEALKSDCNDQKIAPFWIIVDDLSLSVLKEMIIYSKYEDKIYKKLKINKEELETFIKYRNQIAHVNPLELNIKNKFYLDVFLEMLFRDNEIYKMKVKSIIKKFEEKNNEVWIQVDENQKWKKILKILKEKCN